MNKNNNNNIYVLNRHCWHCDKEMTDDEFRLKIAKVDKNYSLFFGRIFYIPSYILCTACKFYMFKIDIICDIILCTCLIFLLKFLITTN